VYQHITTHLPLFLRSPRNLTLLGAAAVAAGAAGYYFTRKRLTPEEIELARRDKLAHTGRITDGCITDAEWPTLVDTDTPQPSPSILTYSYLIAGVSYECAQDVTALPDLVRHVRIDLPIQIRFDPRNPADSIVVAESWSGLRLGAPSPSTPTQPNNPPL
jgi:hypothetical protein